MPKQLLSRTVFDALRERILSGELLPGEKLTVRVIAQELDVSENPVREALWMLAQAGLVENRPLAGTRVKEYSQQEILETYEIRGHLEALAVSLAVQHSDSAHKARVQSIMQELSAAVAAGDDAEYGELNRRFHEAYVDACPNRRLLEVIDGLWDGQSGLRRVFRVVASRMDESHAEHKQMVAALLAGDVARAVELAVEHRNRSATAAMALIGRHDEKKDEEITSAGGER